MLNDRVAESYKFFWTVFWPWIYFWKLHYIDWETILKGIGYYSAQPKKLSNLCFLNEYKTLLGQGAFNTLGHL